MHSQDGLKGILSVFVLVMLLADYGILGFRTVCYPNEHENCVETKDFIEVYKNLSRSDNNRTSADTYFWLFTRKNREKPELLHRCAGNLPLNTTFNPENELIVIISPYLAGFCDFAVYREWLHQLLERGDYNVLIVDWSWGSKMHYTASIANGKIAAKQSAIIIRNIQDETGITKDKIRVIGHSLAAHVAGFIGQDIPVGRITGLDPAGPGFTNKVSIDDRLDPTDADFVDVWHCNAGCFPNLGIDYDAGDVDFWINGGTVQKSCIETIIPSFLRGDFIYAFENLMPTSCSHVQCSQYYKVAINPGDCQFVGVKCDNYEKFMNGKCHRCGENGENCIIMGLDTFKNDTEYSERYYVKTSDSCPYCNNSDIDLQGFSNIYDSSLQKMK